VQHRSVLFRTAEGTKLISSAINNQVLFEADGSTADEGWSVIVKGTARSPRTDEELNETGRGMAISLDGDAKAAFCPHPPAEYHRAAMALARRVENCWRFCWSVMDGR
jgi:hypothetical protein